MDENVTDLPASTVCPLSDDKLASFSDCVYERISHDV